MVGSTPLTLDFIIDLALQVSIPGCPDDSRYFPNNSVKIIPPRRPYWMCQVILPENILFEFNYGSNKTLHFSGWFNFLPMNSGLIRSYTTILRGRKPTQKIASNPCVLVNMRSVDTTFFSSSSVNSSSDSSSRTKGHSRQWFDYIPPLLLYLK